jgi:hypothetical protein
LQAADVAWWDRRFRLSFQMRGASAKGRSPAIISGRDVAHALVRAASPLVATLDEVSRRVSTQHA